MAPDKEGNQPRHFKHQSQLSKTIVAHRSKLNTFKDLHEWDESERSLLPHTRSNQEATLDTSPPSKQTKRGDPTSTPRHTGARSRRDQPDPSEMPSICAGAEPRQNNKTHAKPDSTVSSWSPKPAVKHKQQHLYKQHGPPPTLPACVDAHFRTAMYVH